MDFTFNSLNVVSLNVRGIRYITKRKAIFLRKRSEADLILLQEKDSCESDENFWKIQYGNVAYLSHSTNHSVGVLIFLHTFKGGVLEYVSSNDGSWITLIVKQDNAILIYYFQYIWIQFPCF